LAKAGVMVKVGYDIDPACRYPYEANNGARFVHKSVADLTAGDIRPWFTGGSVRLLAGCAPCQPFSTLANSAATRDQEKWGLLGEFARLVRDVRPELVTMENVPRVTYSNERLAKVRN
jgi:DNA (cytosine-5)-methyltransferase 1